MSGPDDPRKNRAPQASERIVLIGPRGVGKTLVGFLLADILRLPWVDSDVYLYRELGFPSKDDYSPEEFRAKQELELECLIATKDRPGFVFSSGEGLILNQSLSLLEHVGEILASLPHVIFLRPKGTMEESSLQLFRGLSTLEVETKPRPVEEVVLSILQAVRDELPP